MHCGLPANAMDLHHSCHTAWIRSPVYFTQILTLNLPLDAMPVLADQLLWFPHASPLPAPQQFPLVLKPPLAWQVPS